MCSQLVDNETIEKASDYFPSFMQHVEPPSLLNFSLSAWVVTDVMFLINTFNNLMDGSVKLLVQTFTA